MAAACLQTAAPRASKALKEHFLIFHRYSTELFRGWTCLLDFCKLLANMGLWKIVNFSAFGKPDASKMINVSAFRKNRYATRYSSYIYDFVEFILGFCSKHNFLFDMQCDIPHIYIYMCCSSNVVLHMQHDIPHIYKQKQALT